MRLVTRFSAYFLTALALVLLGFSGALYLLARTYLHQRLDERLVWALNILEASVDIERQGLEWEPTDRRILLGFDLGPEEVRWVVRDGGGTIVDRSANAARGGFQSDWKARIPPGQSPDATSFGRVPGWRMAGRRMDLDVLRKLGRGHPDDEPGYEVQYSSLVLIAGLEPAPIQSILNRLAITLATLSLGIWLLAATGGRVLARSALAPLTTMAETVGRMSATDLNRRLENPGTDDELEALGNAFNALLDRLGDAFDRQRLFAGDASHQLRTPLAALLGQVEVARRRERSTEEYRRVLDRVHDEGKRLREVVEAMLFLAQPDGPQLVLQGVSLADWIPEHLKRWSEHPRANDLSFQRASNGTGYRVQAHLPMLAQLLDNLLDNACKYSALGSPIVVRLGRDPLANQVLLSVEDQGCGLNAHETALVFDPFFRSERARCQGTPGIGLGLAVARRIALALNGTLEAQHGSVSGTCFILRLPEIA